MTLMEERITDEEGKGTTDGADKTDDTDEDKMKEM